MGQSNVQHRSVTERAAEARQLLTDLYPKMHSILQPDKYPLFLDLAARFHWYTYFNQLLIYFAYPQARYIAGYTVWEQISEETYNVTNRRIVKPEVKKPIKLVTPFTVSENHEARTRRLVYVAVSAYDIQQVIDLPAPKNDFLSPDRYSIEDLTSAINCVAPYRMCYATSGDKCMSYHLKGYCNHSLQQVVVDGTLPPRSLVHVLLHEYAEAEVYLAKYQNKRLKQLVVESIFYVLLKHFDLSAENIMFSYVDRYKEISQQDLAKALSVIQSVSHRIIEKVDDQLECLVHFAPYGEDYPSQACFDDIDLMQGFDF